MRCVAIKKYRFDQLSKAVQQKVIDRDRGYHTDGVDWWENVYHDAERIGLRITSFDCYRREIDGKLTQSGDWVCRQIFSDHGPGCDTYKIAARYAISFQVCKATLRLLGVENEDWQYESDYQEIEIDLKKDLLQCYLHMLDEEYEYLTSDECLRETFSESDWIMFDKEGNLL